MYFNVREILDRYEIEWEDTHNNSELLYYCPFHAHSDLNMGSSLINEDTGLFNCFACSEGGNIFKFVSKLENISLEDAYELIRNNFNTSKTYDLKLLKIRNKPKIKQSPLGEKIINKILIQLCFINSIEFKQKWLIISTYIRAVELTEKQLLEIFSEFNKEFKNYGQLL